MKSSLETVSAPEVTGIGGEGGDTEDRWVISKLVKPVLELPILIHLVIQHDAQLPQLIEAIDLVRAQ